MTRSAHEALTPAILSKAEGNPFFLEELCRPSPTTRTRRRWSRCRTRSRRPCGRASIACRKTSRMRSAWRGHRTGNPVPAPPGGVAGSRRHHGAPPRAHAPRVPLRADPARRVRLRVQARADPGSGLRQPAGRAPAHPARGGRAGPRAPLRGAAGGDGRPAGLPLRPDRPVGARRRMPLARGREGGSGPRAHGSPGRARRGALPRGAAPGRRARSPPSPARSPQGVVADPPRALR